MLKTILQVQSEELVDQIVDANPNLNKGHVTLGVTLAMNALALYGMFYTCRRVNKGINNIVTAQGGTPLTRKQTRPIGLLVAGAMAQVTWARQVKD